MRFLKLLAVTAVVFAGAVSPAYAKNNCDGKKATIVIGVYSSKVYNAENADCQRYPASLVKLMTVELVFELIKNKTLRFDDLIIISARARSADKKTPGKFRLEKREYTIEECIARIAANSSNGCALALAEAVAGSEEQFATLMNQRAKELGMKNTVYRNPHGLACRHERFYKGYCRGSQYTTARDLSKLLRHIVSKYDSWYWRYFGEQTKVNDETFTSHSRFVKLYPDQVPNTQVAAKTGLINESGWNLAAAVNRNDYNFVAIVMGEPSKKRRSKKMAEIINNAYNKATRSKQVAYKK